MRQGRLKDLNSRGNKILTPLDIFLIVCLLSISILGALYIRMPERESVLIKVEGELKGVYSLKEERIIEVKGPLGTTVVEIRSGKVGVISSPCQNKLCLHQGFISRGGIICLPNRVVITIGTRDIDAITG